MFQEKYYGYFCTCERCGHSWETRYSYSNRTAKNVPKSCAKCKSKQWNSPRVYSGKYIETTFTKREKATGKKAKKESALSSD